MTITAIQQSRCTIQMQLPLFAVSVQAGFPSPAEDYMQGSLDLNELCIEHPAATYFVRAVGDSMVGVGIHSGDVLVVDRALEPKNGSVVIAAVNGELTVKQLIIERGKHCFRAANSHYPDLHVTEFMAIEIWGVVTNVVHSLR
jgi:DNA polymerase V